MPPEETSAPPDPCPTEESSPASDPTEEPSSEPPPEPSPTEPPPESSSFAVGDCGTEETPCVMTLPEELLPAFLLAAALIVALLAALLVTTWGHGD